MKLTITRCRIGDYITTGGHDGLTGEVVALRDISATRQVLTLKTSEGTIVPATVDLVDGITIVLPPASLPEAVALANTIVSGHEPHLSVSVQVSILANAVISMAAGVVPPMEAPHG